jgi:hypothetical protein
MDVAIACLRHVIRLIWHFACLPHTVHLSSIDFWPVCNGSLSGGDITQLNLLNAGLCHHPSVPGQQRFLRSLQHSATNSGNCHLSEKNTVCQVNCHPAKHASADSLCHITRPDIGDLSPIAHCLLFSFPCSPCGHDTWQKCQQMRQRGRIFRLSQVYFLLRVKHALIAREVME